MRNRKHAVHGLLCAVLTAASVLPSMVNAQDYSSPSAFTRPGDPGYSLTTQASEPQVRWINGEYTETHIDLRVQVLGGPLDIVRSWSQGRWWLNPAWAPLNFELDPLGRDARIIERAGVLYERSGQADLYIAKGKNNAPVFIKRLPEGGSAQNPLAQWRWYDRLGNSIDYDAQGRILGYANTNGINVRFAYDSATRARILDHHGGTVYTATLANGLITRIEDRAGRSVSYQWNGQLLTQATDVMGQRWSYTYDANGQLTSRTDPLGAQVTVQYSQSIPAPAPLLTLGAAGKVLDPTGTSGTTSKLANLWGGGRVGKFDGQGCASTGKNQYLREKRQFLVTYLDCRGNTTVYLYDKEGNELERTFNGKPAAKTLWDGNYQTRAIDARGLTTTTSYDYNYQPLQIIHPDGSRDQYEYEPVRGLRTKHINQGGITSIWTHDDKGRVITWTQALGRPEQRTTRYQYDSYGQLTSRSTGAGDGKGDDARTTSYRYDNNGSLIEATDPLGHSSSASYDARGLPATQTDALGNTTTLGFDAAGRLIKATDALNQTTSHQYDARGRRTQSTSAAGRTKQTRYDPQGRVIETIAPGQTQGAGTRITYDSTGLPLSTTSPSGLITQITYDNRGRIASSIDAAGSTITYAYGEDGSPQAGLLIATQYPTYKETYQYDQSGTQTAVTQHLANPSTPDQTRTQHQQYDSLGQRAVSIDPAGRTTIYEYDGLGRVVKTLDPLAQATKQTWNAHDQLTSLTDAKGNTHRFEYDKAGRLTKEIRPMGGAIQYSYDAAGQLTKRTDAGGNTRSYAYDKAGRMVHEEHQLKGTETDQQISYQYDADGLLTAYEQKDGQQNLISSATYDKDAQGRTTQNKITYGKVDNTGSFSFTVGQSYNADGQLAGHSYPDGSAGQYSYDKGRLSLVTLPDQSQIRYGNYQWLTATRIETPGATKTLSLDALQRPLSIEVKNAATELLVSRHYQYDKAGNITQIVSDLGTTEYGYDSLDRLTKAAPNQPLKDLGLPTEQYQYDAVHNRVFSGHQAGQWHYNADNQLTSYPRLRPFDKAAQVVQTQVEYTLQGHTARESSDKVERTYSYNAAERLIRYASTAEGQNTPSIEAQYRYDPLGRRISKEVKEGQATKITYFFYSVTGLLGEINEQEVMMKAYAFDPQKAQQGQWSTDPIWQAEVNEAQLTNRSSSVHYLHTDHLGTPVLGTSKQGASTWKSVAEAFGAAGILPQNLVEVNLRFPGQYFDVTMGLNYNYNRDYQQISGRYMQQDPIGLSGGLNVYGYASQNPIYRFDTLGLSDVGGCPRCEYKDKPDDCKLICISLPGAWEVGCFRYESRCGGWTTVNFSSNTWIDRPFAIVGIISCKDFDFLKKYPDPNNRPPLA
ncbi:Cell wall-associated polypeptide CWBP200 [Delftia tsuruhatensis]|uniref:RHS repeat-associated core domain-containing protein n=1 Tax=Delftia tsuruhatensis TaxID=180282 RepID=UPI001E7AEFC1|nr:RHS repeat-associated core domain-containing protein [Delftia tsuruhatensis]CAB5666213.1 Cell wall-associated polypeptide CWBP200 [Delftia tsuruhatensis]CAC9677718.1 Cell wall-associated polypeptide CWBP200 [Delftia tsuruhatensis]